MSDYIKNVQMNSNLNKPQESNSVKFGIIKTKTGKFDSFEIDRDKAKN